MTTVLIVDDHPVFRRGLAVMLTASGYPVVGEAASGDEGVARARELRPDVVVMDLGLPEMHGAVATELIVAENPDIRVVAMTMFDDDRSVQRALAAGAIGYVVKDAPPEEIIAAVHAATLGASLLGSGVTRHVGPITPPAPRDDPFTRREREVAALLEKGLTNRAIANRLGISDKTVANYVAAVLLKLGATDRYDAARLLRGGA